jgi:isoleucyl-tRNA synthetase
MPEKTENKPTKSKIAEQEEKTLAFWRENNIFEKSLQKESPKGNFVFYDGPPFATGLPHFGHILPNTIKDIIPRYKTMQGYRVPRKWGWDCHGLPVENLIEKELGLKNKKDIEEYGIEKFNAAARNSVLRYADAWGEMIPRVGRWADMKNDYRTMDWQYSESVWWSFKSLFDKGRIYEGFKAMQICPRCGTTLSNFEVNQGYKDITDLSVYAKFELLDEPGTFVIAWTTTPWTLPGNVALAVNPEVEYVKAKNKDGVFIFAKERYAPIAEKFLSKDPGEVVGTIKGSDLVGKSYKPLFDYYQNVPLKNAEGKILTEKTGWKIYAGDFVTTTDGTGIVHIASAFGEDDLRMGQKENLPFIQHVDFEGKFKKEVVDFAGQYVKPKDDVEKADVEIVKYLAHNGLLFAKEKFIHSYPHCWRCETPLLNYATSSWFVRVTDFKDMLVDANKKVDWVPESIGEGRFGKWLEGARDWAISRSRYWGAPLPVWRCDHCEQVEVLGSIAELKAKTKRNTYFVMRHGLAEHNVKNILSSKPDHPHHLTDVGREESALSAQALRDKHIDLIFSSPYVRTRETSEIVVEQIGFKGKIALDDRLSELNFGDLDLLDREKYFGYFSSVGERLTKRLPNGENIHDVRDRMGNFIYDIDSKYEGKNILIVTHEAPATALFGVGEGAVDKNLIEMWGMDRDFISPGQMMPFEFSAIPHNEQYELDVHRPYSDSISFKCDCGGDMKRVPEVLDTWYDSGSVPFAQHHYPFEHKEHFEKGKDMLFPADFIAEGLDQTRGWFYSLLILGVELFKTAPYKNVVVNGLILAEDGHKMSKSLNNYPPLMDTVDKFSADALRYFLVSSPAVKAEEVAFSEKGLDEVQKKILMRLLNVVSFYEMYSVHLVQTKENPESKNILDRWIVARLHEMTKAMTEALDAYELDKAARPIADFVDDLSTWYLRRSRDRFKGDDQEDKQAALLTTRHVLKEFSKLIAPFIPFIAEEVYQKVKGSSGKESVHLEDWSAVHHADEVLLENMAQVRHIVSLGLEARSKAGIKVRQPLQAFKIKNTELSGMGFKALIQEEMNVKEVIFEDLKEGEVWLDAELTAELKLEGQMRELLRAIQDLRKESGLNVEDRVVLMIETSDEGKKLVKKFETEISKPAGLIKITFETIDAPEIKIDDLAFRLKLEK